MDDKLVNIIEKSLQMFRDYGIRSVSMDDISREMGMSKKTLYQYVANKSDLVAKILEHESAKRMQLIKDTIRDDMNAIDLLIAVSKAMNKMFSEFNPSMNFDLQKYYPEIIKAHSQKKREKVICEIKENLILGIQQGLYRNDLDVDLISSLYIQKIKDLHDPDFMESGDFKFEKIFEVMIEDHIRGIANEKGLKYFEKKKQDLQLK